MNPDLLILADTIHTMDATFLPGDGPQAVAVQDGVIVAVGTREEAAAWPAARQVLDFGPAVVTPGLVDCHMHPVFGLELMRGVDLSGAQDLAEVRARLRAEAALVPADASDPWVRAWGLDPNSLGASNSMGASAPHRDMIDDVVDGQPCLIRLFDGHSALANSRALELAGINGPHEFDQASEVVCDDLGRPTGLLLESAAIELVGRIMPEEPFADRKVRLAEVLASFARSGLTGAHVMDLDEGSLELYRALESDGELPLRLRISPWCMPGTGEEEWASLASQIGTRGRRWELGGIKLFVDGTVDNGTAWLFEPDIYGQSTASFWPQPEEYANAVRYFASRGISTATHAIGDAGVAAVLDAFESLETESPAAHRIEHIETVPDSVVERFAASGLVASMQPTHCTHYSRADQGDNWSTRLGHERASNGWRCGDLRSVGVTLGLGSDWPIAPFEPLPIIADAQLRRRSGHRDEEAIVPSQALTALQALEGYTSHAAKAAGEWAISGSISVGKRADFTVLEADPLEVDPDGLAESKVLATLVDGRLQYSVAGVTP